MKYRNVVQKYGQKAVVVATVTFLPVVSFAQTGAAQPDTADSVAYIAAGVATILAAMGGKYIIGAVMFIGRKVMSALGR